MKVLITGAAGQLGRVLDSRFTSIAEVIATTRDGRDVNNRPTQSMDLAVPASIEQAIRQSRPDVIFNAAAYTAVDRAESEPEMAALVNTTAPEVIAREAAKTGALLVHFSTDYVFSGAANRPWRESDPTVPINVYGNTKLGGEEKVRTSGAKHLILRTAWLYGARGQNFLTTMLKLAAERPTLQVVDDQVGAPTAVERVAHVVAQILERLTGGARDIIAEPGARGGTYHLTAAGHTNWYRYAETLFDLAHTRGLLTTKPALEPVGSDHFDRAAKRPAYSVLDCTRIKDAFGVSLPPWEQDLARCVEQMARKNMESEGAKQC